MASSMVTATQPSPTGRSTWWAVRPEPQTSHLPLLGRSTVVSAPTNTDLTTSVPASVVKRGGPTDGSAAGGPRSSATYPRTPRSSEVPSAISTSRLIRAANEPRRRSSSGFGSGPGSLPPDENRRDRPCGRAPGSHRILLSVSNVGLVPTLVTEKTATAHPGQGSASRRPLSRGTAVPGSTARSAVGASSARPRPAPLTTSPRSGGGRATGSRRPRGRRLSVSGYACWTSFPPSSASGTERTSKSWVAP